MCYEALAGIHDPIALRAALEKLREAYGTLPDDYFNAEKIIVKDAAPLLKVFAMLPAKETPCPKN